MLCSLSSDAKKGRKVEKGKKVEEPTAGLSNGQLFEMFQRLECLLDANTEALELVEMGLSIYQQTRRTKEKEEEEEGEKRMSEKAKGKRRQQ